MQNFSANKVKVRKRNTVAKLVFLLISLILVSMSFAESGIQMLRYSYKPLGAAVDEFQALQHPNFPVGNAAFFMNYVDGAPDEKRTLTFRQSDYGFYALSPWQQHFAPEMEELYKLRTLTEISTVMAERNIPYIATPNYMPVTLYNSYFGQLIADPEYTDQVYLSSHGYKIFRLVPAKRDVECVPLHLPALATAQSPTMDSVYLVSTTSLVDKPLRRGPLPRQYQQTILDDAEVKMTLRLSLPDDTLLEDSLTSRGLFIEAQVNGTTQLRAELTQLDWLDSRLSVSSNWNSTKRSRSHQLFFQSLISPETRSAELTFYANGVDGDFSIESVQACIFSKPYPVVQNPFGIGISDVLNQFPPAPPSRPTTPNTNRRELTWDLREMPEVPMRRFISGTYYPTLRPSTLSFTLFKAPPTSSPGIAVTSMDRQEMCNTTGDGAHTILFSSNEIFDQSQYAHILEYLFWLYHTSLSIAAAPSDNLSNRVADFLFGDQAQYLLHMNASGTGRVSIYANWINADGERNIRFLSSFLLTDDTSSRSSLARLPANATDISLMAALSLPSSCDALEDGLLLEIKELSLHKLIQAPPAQQ